MRKNLNLVARGYFDLLGPSLLASLLVAMLFLVVGVSTAFAAPFAPGETLDPGCTPGSANCTVLQIAVDTTTNKYGIGTSTPWAKLSVAGVSSLGTSPLFTVSSSTNSATSTVFHIDYTGNVGIGATTTPGTLLSVQGVANFGTATSTFRSTGGINLLSGCFAVNGSCVGAGGGSGTVNAATSIGQVPFYAAASNAVTATSTLFVSTASNVGIGTTTPEGKLEVAGNIFLSGLSSGLRKFQVGTTSADTDVNGTDLDILAGGAVSTSGNGFGGSLLIMAGIGGGNTGSTGGSVTIRGGSGYTGGALTTHGGDSNIGGSATFRAGDGSSGAGGTLTLKSGGGGTDASSNGGPINITAGSAQNGNGGTITITAGDGLSGSPGDVLIKAGGAGASGGGTATLQGGDNTGAGAGTAVLRGGDNTSDAGGAVTIRGGNSNTGSVAGANVSIYGGSGLTGGNVILAYTGSVVQGLVGIGTSTPLGQLSVHAPAGTPSFVVGSSTRTYFIINSSGNVGIGTTTPTLGPLTMDSGAYVTTGGSWTNASSRGLKENFTELDPQDVLGKINSLDITRWNYKTEPSDVTHIGPIAEDFYQTFQVGGPSGGKSISSIDPAGVALIGIQALSEKVKALENRGYASGISFDSVVGSLRDLGTDITSGLATFKNIIADTLTVKKLCVEDVCITKTELQELLNKNGLNQSASVGNSVASSTSSNEADQANEASPTDSEPPVITVAGNNPATVEKGNSYADLGATVTDNVNNNLGVTTSGDEVDTSIVGAYTVVYTATDQAGNVGTAERVVNVVEPLNPSFNLTSESLTTATTTP
ncbi:MAG: immunoglobulin-like domain-containing protein [Candidatus Paceibacterota bacterium]